MFFNSVVLRAAYAYTIINYILQMTADPQNFFPQTVFFQLSCIESHHNSQKQLQTDIPHKLC